MGINTENNLSRRKGLVDQYEREEKKNTIQLFLIHRKKLQRRLFFQSRFGFASKKIRSITTNEGMTHQNTLQSSRIFFVQPGLQYDISKNVGFQMYFGEFAYEVSKNPEGNIPFEVNLGFSNWRFGLSILLNKKRLSKTD